jgi:hypothetical protein
MENGQFLLLGMTTFEWIVVLITLITFAPLVIGLVKNPRDKSQIFITWFLYFLVDFITSIFSDKVDGFRPLLIGSAIGSFILAAILFFQRRFAGSIKEPLILTILVAICLLIWYKCGPFSAMLAGVGSECLVGGYLAYKTWRNPEPEYNLPGYTIFLFASLISVIWGGKNWTLENKLYSSCEVILCTLTIIPLIREKLRGNIRLVLTHI